MKQKKRKSIRFNIVVYFSVAMMLAVLLTSLLIRVISISVLEQTIRGYLVSAVDANVDEITYLSQKERKRQTFSNNLLIDYRNGYLEIDYDFLDVMNEVESALYQEDGTILYGKNPIAKEMSGKGFTSSRIYKKRVNGMDYYIYDRKIVGEHLEGLWIRGVVPLARQSKQIGDITKDTALFFPIIIVMAIGVGCFVARRILRPIQKMEKVTEDISKGTDLKKRINLGEGEDELYHLADHFDAMISRLDQAFEAERRFTSDASHELRTPMSVIMAQTELTLEQDREKEEYKAALEVIHRQGSRMNRLIENMLDYTRLEQRTVEYPLETINLSEQVSAICEDMKLIRNKEITLTYQVESGVTIRGNALLLGRMLQNLIDNAYKYGKEQGHICVLLQRKWKDELEDWMRPEQSVKEYVLLTVEDDGIGISQSAKEKIFERFYREDASRSNHSAQGYGLGLSMVKKIAELHQATIWVQSEEDVGSRFIVIFGI